MIKTSAKKFANNSQFEIKKLILKIDNYLKE